MDQLSPEQVAALRAEDQGPLCERIVITFTILAFVSVCLRLFTRFRYHKIGFEDHTIIIAVVCYVASTEEANTDLYLQLAAMGTGVFQVLRKSCRYDGFG